MGGSFEVAWADSSLLQVRRSGLFSVAEAESYQAAMEEALRAARPPWGIVVDVRGAPAQSVAVQPILEGVMRRTEEAGVCRVAIVVESAVTKLQQRRLTGAPGAHSSDSVVYFTEVGAAIQDVRSAVAATSS